MKTKMVPSDSPLPPDHIVLEEGGFGEEMYIVLKGELQVTFESGASRNDVPKMRISTRVAGGPLRGRKEGWVPTGAPQTGGSRAFLTPLSIFSPPSICF